MGRREKVFSVLDFEEHVIFSEGNSIEVDISEGVIDL